MRTADPLCASEQGHQTKTGAQSGLITCQHLVHGGRHVHLRQALAALGVVEAHVRAALQRQPHALAVRHHAGDAAAAVGAHLEPLLQRRAEGVGGS